ncbi:hypothetical protein CN03_08940 [Thalassolituus oleivorans]|jgi:hypothetical protein|uniref:hypothetical protein n=1 Tax=Thalassolituus oleivorans TaxID=187493 RepID=UPI00094939BE|nr:hypothetical protein [Thalassolituus oleivorans]APR67047.1 hypothetical protein CN03_08940 [Thalassolituus oleivorans]
MDKKLQGSWLIHHTNKLQNVTNQGQYQSTFVAGKAGILLSAISETNQSVLPNDKLEVLANASNINIGFELPRLLELLKEQELIDVTASGVGVLGVTTSSALQHTSSIFESLSPKNIEISAIELAESASIKPVRSSELGERLSDDYKLSTKEIKQLFYDSESIGFVDAEPIGKDEKLLFNGNLFRRDSAVKTKAVLDSLNSSEQAALTELIQSLKKNACVPYPDALKILGERLFKKVNAIGFFDVNVVSNSQEEVGYLTLPAAFSKFSSSMVDDAFDLAKAFVASLTYGMTKSDYARGQISMIDRLLGALIDGREVGPVSAIGQDYKILELKGVVSIRHGTKGGRSGPLMRLLKKEVGELALQAIRQGDVSEQSIIALPGAAITKFRGPEVNREIIRREQIQKSPFETNDMISALRTGGGF